MSHPKRAVRPVGGAAPTRPPRGRSAGAVLLSFLPGGATTCWPAVQRAPESAAAESLQAQLQPSTLPTVIPSTVCVVRKVASIGPSLTRGPPCGWGLGRAPFMAVVRDVRQLKKSSGLIIILDPARQTRVSAGDGPLSAGCERRAADGAGAPLRSARGRRARGPLCAGQSAAGSAGERSCTTW